MISRRRFLVRIRRHRAIALITAINIACLLILARPVAAETFRIVGLTKSAADTLYCKLTGCSMSGAIAGTVTLSPTSKVVDLTNASGTGHIDDATSGVTFFLGPVLGGLGAVTNRTIGQSAACMYDTNGAANLWCMDGVGIESMITGVTASNNLVGTSACAASGDVGKRVLYSDTSTSKITECVCEQTGAGTFAWGAVTAVGDCT